MLSNIHHIIAMARALGFITLERQYVATRLPLASITIWNVIGANLSLIYGTIKNVRRPSSDLHTS